MNELTPQNYQRIIATLNAQKAAAELAAMEWQVRYENTVQATQEGADGE